MSIRDLSPETLRDYIQNHHEKTYRLVDVRQPGEYQMVHIPGAQLIPLPQLLQDLEALPVDQDLIFYCRSGARSSTAAVLASEEEITTRPIYNLAGGMLAWEGATVTDQPEVVLFDGQSEVEMLYTAMNLEKGAFRFYSHVASAYGAHDWSEIFGHLGKVETAHARIVYGYWKRTVEQPESFEAVFERLSGEVLEGGQPLETALSTLREQTGLTCMGLVEMAMKMEYRAFDLYRTMADQAEDSEARKAFLSISQAEKGHMKALVGAIEACG